MSNITEFLYQGFATFLFCIAIFLLVKNYHFSISLLEEGQAHMNSERIITQIPDREESIEHYSKGYIQALLLEVLDYDILVDHYFISKQNHYKGKIKDYPMEYEWYEKSYTYDDSGEIKTIIFQGIY